MRPKGWVVFRTQVLTAAALCGLGDEVQDVVGLGRSAPGKLVRRRRKRERA